MKGFLEEYGLIIVVVTVVVIMLALGTNVGNQVTKAITETIAELLQKAKDSTAGQAPAGPAILALF